MVPKSLLLFLVIPCEGEPHTWLVSSLQLFLGALDFDFKKVIDYFEKAGFKSPLSKEKVATVRFLQSSIPPLPPFPGSSAQALTYS